MVQWLRQFLWSSQSIRWRLLLSIGLSLPILWIVVAAVSVQEVFEEINEISDSQMSVVGRHLLQTSITAVDHAIELSDLETLLSDDDAEGEAEDDALGFALWDNHGVLLASDAMGKALPYRDNVEGFTDTGRWWHDESLRILYLYAPERQRVLAIGQAWEERMEMLSHTVMAQMMVLLLTLPVLLGLILWLVHQALRPLAMVTKEVDDRSADDLTPITVPIPDELQPLITSFNGLFDRVAQLMAQEQRFTADAAHELRSPLAAIRSQSEALLLSQNIEQQYHHAQQIQSSVDRSAHLIDQLLILARLEPAQQASMDEHIDWVAISDEALASVHRIALEQEVRLIRNLEEASDTNAELIPLSSPLSLPLPKRGDPVLLVLMLRNLLDNAIRYGTSGREVLLTMTSHAITIRDYGEGIAPAHLPRVRERFYRPSGQCQSGSGLGLSIVARIAELHGLQLTLKNHPDGGAIARLSASQRSSV